MFHVKRACASVPRETPILRANPRKTPGDLLDLARILCVGMSALDAIYRVPAIPIAPVKILATGFSESGGGMASNAGVGVARLGGAAEYWGRLGTDALGDRMLAALTAEGVRVGGVRLIPGSVSVRGHPGRPRRRAAHLCLQRSGTGWRFQLAAFGPRGVVRRDAGGCSVARGGGSGA